jgi:hypothetical protein
MSRVDQEFNLFKCFVIAGKDSEGNKVNKIFTLDEVINGKNSFYVELKDGLEKKLKICLKIWLRVRNLDKIKNAKNE